MNLGYSNVDVEGKDTVDPNLLDESIEISNCTKDCLFELFGNYIPEDKQNYKMEDIVSVISSEQALRRSEMLNFENSHYIIDGICSFSSSNDLPKITVVVFSEDFQVERWAEVCQPIGEYWIEAMKKLGVSDGPSLIREYNRWNWVETNLHESIHSFQNQLLIKVGKEKRFIDSGVDYFVGMVGDLASRRSNHMFEIFKYHEMTKDTIKIHHLIFQRLIRDFGADVMNLFFNENVNVLSKEKIINDCSRYYSDVIAMSKNSL